MKRESKYRCNHNYEEKNWKHSLGENVENKPLMRMHDYFKCLLPILFLFFESAVKGKDRENMLNSKRHECLIFTPLPFTAFASFKLPYFL